MHYGRCASGVCSGIHAVDFGFQVLDTGFFQSVKLRFWILKTRIPHSTSKNLLLFGFPRKNSLDCGNPDILTWATQHTPLRHFLYKEIVPFFSGFHSYPVTLLLLHGA